MFSRPYIFCLALTLLLSSCTPKNRPAPPPPDRKGSPEAPIDRADLPDPAGSLRLTRITEPEDDIEEETAEDPEARDFPEFTGPMALQRIKSQAYVLPSSLMIGDLADPLAFNPAEREVYELARRFWGEYRKGNIPYVSTGSHPLFEEELNEFRDLGPEIRSVYSGSIRLSGQTGSFKSVLLSDSGYIRGDVYIRNDGEGWLVEDWEIPFRNWPGKSVPLEGDLTQMRYSY